MRRNWWRNCAKVEQGHGHRGGHPGEEDAELGLEREGRKGEGSLVLDILPVIGQEPGDILAEGKVTECGGTMAYLGGEVGNTGLALHKMHIPVRLVSKIGSDTIGKIVKSLLENYNAEHILKEQLNSVSSASVALALPGRDKSTLHSRGASQSFASEDITPEVLEHCFLLHFGYPPAMKYLGKMEKNFCG